MTEETTMREIDARRLVEQRHGMEFGVESVALATGAELLYINRGDTYDETLVSIDDGETWRWSSLGDEYETAEAEHYQETEEQRCCYCGTLTVCKPHNARSWSGPACGPCRGEES